MQTEKRKVDAVKAAASDELQGIAVCYGQKLNNQLC